MLRDPILKLDTKPIERSLPIPNRHIPFLANIAQCQVEQFAQCLIAWKRSTVLGNFAQAHVHGFDGIGRVDHFSNLRRIIKEGNDALPVAAPALHDRGVVFIPHRFELIQGL